MRTMAGPAMAFVAAWALSACSSANVIPPELEKQIDSSVSFSDIQASPQSAQGRTVLLGGEVLGARRVQDGIELEILQLPDEAAPSAERLHLNGRITFDQVSFAYPSRTDFTVLKNLKFEIAAG